jgi:hypothetical protein
MYRRIIKEVDVGEGGTIAQGGSLVDNYVDVFQKERVSLAIQPEDSLLYDLKTPLAD